MAVFYTAETTGKDALPVIKEASPAYAGTTKVFQSTINLATVAGGAAVGTADQIVLADVPAGYKFLYGVLTATVTLGASATVAIGTNQTHGSNGQYRAAAVNTAVNTPAMFDVPTTGSQAAALAATTRIWLTVGVAALPTVGLVTVQLFYALDN